MKKTRIGLVIISLLLVCAMAVNLTGCTMEVQAKDLMEGITPNNVNTVQVQYTDFVDLEPNAVIDSAAAIYRAKISGGDVLIPE